MASQVRTFLYSAVQIAALERTISRERLSPYVTAAGGDKAVAVLLYERNTAISESIYGVLQALEVTVRNSMHDTLSRAIGRPDWYHHAPLHTPEQEAVAKSKRKLKADSKPETPGRVVAELSFGFWTALADKRYARSLWVPHLYKAFPHRRMNHKRAHARLDIIRKLRNRVAHHEPITSRNLVQDLADIIETIGWICPTTALWADETNSLKPKLGLPVPSAADLPATIAPTKTEAP